MVSKGGAPVFAWVKGKSRDSKVNLIDENGELTELGYPAATNFTLCDISNEGIVYGHATITEVDENVSRSKPFIIRKSSGGDWEFEFLPCEAGKSSGLLSANGVSETVGYEYSNGRQNPTLWRGKRSRFHLSDHLAGVGLEFKIERALEINNDGEILCDAFDGERSEPYLLRPVADTDGDGTPDAWEIQYSFDPFNADDGQADSDGDGLSNSEEHRFRTDPKKPDTDGDTMKDGWEVEWGLDPLEPADAYADPDGDKVQNRFEHALSTAPTGIYRLEERDVTDSDPDASFYLVASYSLGNSPFSVISATIGGESGSYVVDHGSNSPPVMIPPLVPGKRVIVREIGKSGVIYGCAYDENNKLHVFSYRRGDPKIKIVDIPSDPENHYVYLRDVSSDERSLLVSRRTPGGAYSADVFSIYSDDKEIHDLTENSEFSLQLAILDARENVYNGPLNYSFYPVVCENGNHVLGVQTKYYAQGSSDLIVRRGSDPGEFETILNPSQNVFLDGGYVDYQYGSLSRRSSGEDDGIYYSWSGFKNSGTSLTRNFLIDGNSGQG